MDSQNLLATSLKAALHSISTILSFIFLTPYKLWVKSVERLAKQHDESLVDLHNIDGFWPFLSFLKRFFLDFSLDATTFLAYPIGAVVAIISFFVTLISKDPYTDQVVFYFAEAVATFFGIVAVCYFVVPIACSLTHDFFQLALIPFRKFLSWGSKPAQQLDIDLKNKQQ